MHQNFHSFIWCHCISLCCKKLHFFLYSLCFIKNTILVFEFCPIKNATVNLTRWNPPAETPYVRPSLHSWHSHIFLGVSRTLHTRRRTGEKKEKNQPHLASCADAQMQSELLPHRSTDCNLDPGRPQSFPDAQSAKGGRRRRVAFCAIAAPPARLVLDHPLPTRQPRGPARPARSLRGAAQPGKKRTGAQHGQPGRQRGCSMASSAAREVVAWPSRWAAGLDASTPVTHGGAVRPPDEKQGAGPITCQKKIRTNQQHIGLLLALGLHKRATRGLPASSLPDRPSGAPPARGPTASLAVRLPREALRRRRMPPRRSCAHPDTRAVLPRSRGRLPPRTPHRQRLLAPRAAHTDGSRVCFLRC